MGGGQAQSWGGCGRGSVQRATWRCSLGADVGGEEKSWRRCRRERVPSQRRGGTGVSPASPGADEGREESSPGADVGREGSGRCDHFISDGGESRGCGGVPRAD